MATGQARFTQRYTREQKDALLEAVCIRGMTVAQAVRDAKAGKLGVAAFELDRFYAYDIVKRDRERYEEAHPNALALAIDNQITRLAAKALRMARDTENLPAADPDKIRRALQALNAARATLAKPAPKQTAATVSKPGAEPAKDATLTNLLDHAAKPTKQGARTGSVKRASKRDPSDASSASAA